MNKNLYRITAIIVVMLLLFAACVASSPAGRPTGPLEPGGALDRILLCEHSPEVGSMYFNHRLHYAPLEKGGWELPCAECHHEIEDEPRKIPGACGDCHDDHHDNRYPDRLTL